MKGPAPTPTQSLILAGSKYRAATRIGEPLVPVVAPPCPIVLNKVARGEWDRIVPLLLARRTLGEADMAALAIYCQAWGDFTWATREVNKIQRGVVTYKGNICDHPRVVLTRATERLLKAAGHFGLSPAAKTRVRAEGYPKSEQLTKDRFFAGPRLANG